VPFGWRAVFVAVGIAALTALSLVAFLLPETRPAHQRISGSVRSVFSSFGELLQDRHFLGLTFIGGLGISSFFAFLSTSSFVYIGHNGPDAIQQSILDQCHRLHWSFAICGLPRWPFRYGPDGTGSGFGLCAVRGVVIGADAGVLRQPARADPAIVRLVPWQPSAGRYRRRTARRERCDPHRPDELPLGIASTRANI
jgi:Major Facilitator Superfamily